MLINGINGIYNNPYITETDCRDFSKQSVKETAEKNPRLVKVNYGAVQGYVTKPFSGMNSPEILLKAYLDDNYAKELVEKTPVVNDILADAGIKSPVVCTKNVEEITNGHLKTTKEYALQTADEIGLSDSEKDLLSNAAIMHDYGKILIPREILTKEGKLDAEERVIIDTHAKLGRELLKTAGTNKKVLYLVENHHNPDSKDVLCQVLTTADIYSALREQRSYKPQKTKEEALSIMDKMQIDGKVNADALDALKESIKKEEKNAVQNKQQGNIKIYKSMFIPGQIYAAG